MDMKAEGRTVHQDLNDIIHSLPEAEYTQLLQNIRTYNENQKLIAKRVLKAQDMEEGINRVDEYADNIIEASQPIINAIPATAARFTKVALKIVQPVAKLVKLTMRSQGEKRDEIEWLIERNCVIKYIVFKIIKSFKKDFMITESLSNDRPIEIGETTYDVASDELVQLMRSFEAMFEADLSFKS